jgi:hypothetical protein
MPDTAAILNEAYGLIEQGDLSRARTLLQPLLESDSQNPDVWWLYTHAAADENEGRRALDRVEALDPQYPGAAELRERLGTGPRVLKPLSSLQPKPSSTAPTAVSPAPVIPDVDEPDLDDDDEFAETTSTPQRQRLSRILLIAGGIIIAFALLALLLPSLLNPAPSPTPDVIAGLETPTFDTALTPVLGFESPTVDPLVTPLDGVATTDGAVPTLTTEALIDEFAQTATALVVTSINAQVATEESASPTEAVTVSTEEASANATTEALATENALLPSSTDVVEATSESLATQEVVATIETASMTDEPAATQEATPQATEAILATAEVVATEEATPEATEIAAVPTEEAPTPTVEVTPTEDVAVATVEVTPTEESGLILTEAVTAEPTQSPADTLAAKLEVLNVAPEDVTTVQTTLGPTLIVEVCAPPVASATTALTVTMNALAETVVDVPDVEAVGVNLACEGAAPRIIAVSASEAAAYGRGEIDVRTFRQGWTPTDLVEEEGNG